ncbi:MAG: hypothetical protein FJ265_22345 [Planctomycetes bacterium]|nr:hypothetical protein [Planctomycetota bacterium]
MAEQLESLLKKIEDEAVHRAEASAARILAAAETKAAALVEAAEARARRMVEEAERGVAARTENGQRALEQAGRDLLLHVRRAIGEQFAALAKKVSPELIPIAEVQRIVFRLAERTLKEPDKVLVIDVPEGDREALVQFLLGRLQQTASDHPGIDLRPVPGLRAGFRVAWRGSDWRIDMGDEALATMVAELVSPALRGILTQAAG